MPAGDFEKPSGEWNQLDLYAVGDVQVEFSGENISEAQGIRASKRLLEKISQGL
jgi:hypothetical protein